MTFLVCAFLSIFLTASSGQAKKPASAPPAMSPMGLLHHADMESRDFTVEERANVLEKMAHASVAKLRIMCSLANVYFVRGDQERAMTMTDHALDLGEELYAQFMMANPGAVSYSADGVDEMTGLVGKAVAKVKRPETVVARINQMRQDVLKATLLTAAAEAWGQRAANAG